MKITSEHRQELTKLYKEGKTLKELQKQFGYSQPNISNVLRQVGVEIRPVGRKKRIKDKKLFNINEMKSQPLNLPVGCDLGLEEPKEVKEKLFGPTGSRD